MRAYEPIASGDASLVPPIAQPALQSPTPGTFLPYTR
jgi:hypothetical protein